MRNKFLLTSMSILVGLSIACAKDLDKNDVKELHVVDDAGVFDEGKAVQAPDKTKANPAKAVKIVASAGKADSSTVPPRPVKGIKNPPIFSVAFLGKTMEEKMNQRLSEALSEKMLVELNDYIKKDPTMNSEATLSQLDCRYRILNLESKNRKVEEFEIYNEIALESVGELNWKTNYFTEGSSFKNSTLYVLDNKLSSSILFQMDLGVECIGKGEKVTVNIRTRTDEKNPVFISKDSVAVYRHQGMDFSGLDASKMQAKIKKEIASLSKLKVPFNGYSEFIRVQSQAKDLLSFSTYTGSIRPILSGNAAEIQEECKKIERQYNYASDMEYGQGLARLEVSLDKCEAELLEAKGLDANGEDLHPDLKMEVNLRVEPSVQMEEFLKTENLLVNPFVNKTDLSFILDPDKKQNKQMMEIKSSQEEQAKDWMEREGFEVRDYDDGEPWWSFLTRIKVPPHYVIRIF